MRIAFGSTIFSQQVYGGISRYFCSLAEHLAKLGGVEPKIIAPFHFNQHLKALNKRNVVGCYMPRRKGTGRAVKALSSALFWPAAYLAKPDIVHETYYSSRPVYRAGTPRVITVFDLIHEKFPEYFPASDPTVLQKRDAILRADHIFCISENTRRDLLDSYAVPEERVTLTYLGYDELPIRTGEDARLRKVVPYLLYVGDRRGYKNFLALASAYAKSPWLKDNFRLVCFGGGPFSPLERNALSALGVGAAQVIHIGGDDELLGALYQGAAAFVYPSLYEGFGIPLLEAMSMACPVICSRTSSIPEVVGKAGEYFDPADEESMMHAIERVLQSAARRDELITLGHLQKRLFSWEHCAADTLQGYRTVLE